MSPRAGDRPVVLITGSSRGLGRELALRFARTGYRVALNYRSDHASAQTTVQEIARQGGEARRYPADVRDLQAVRVMMEDIIDRWGIPEILINNAGITVDATLPLLDETSWIEVIETHLKGAFHTIRLLGEQMSSRKRGHILNIGSWVGLKGRPGQSAYAAAKAGLVGLTLSAARELGGDGVQVNIVLPGFLQTSMQQGLTEGARAEILGLHLLSVPPSMEETADWIYFLSQRRGVSGQIFNLDSRPAQTF